MGDEAPPAAVAAIGGLKAAIENVRDDGSAGTWVVFDALTDEVLGTGTNAGAAGDAFAEEAESEWGVMLCAFDSARICAGYSRMQPFSDALRIKFCLVTIAGAAVPFAARARASEGRERAAKLCQSHCSLQCDDLAEAEYAGVKAKVVSASGANYNAGRDRGGATISQEEFVSGAYEVGGGEPGAGDAVEAVGETLEATSIAEEPKVVKKAAPAGGRRKPTRTKRK